MIALIFGKVIQNNGGEVLVQTPGGVGYVLTVSPSASEICRVGEDVVLETYLVVKEDSHDLYGFGNGAEKKLFKSFVSVSGVGPKTAMHLFNLGSVAEIALAVGRGDTDFLTKVSGIGKKTAERIVLELREKINKEQNLPTKHVATKEGGAVNDALEGLIALGYSALQAKETISQLEVDNKSSQQILKEALRIIR
jgi:Holliday junction DNA helicase RuvA